MRRVKTTQDAGFRSAQRTIQELKLGLAAIQPMETESVVSKEEAAAVAAYLLATTRGLGDAEFRRRHRKTWQLVRRVLTRMPRTEEITA